MSSLDNCIDGLFVTRKGSVIRFDSDGPISDVRLDVPISQYSMLPYRLRKWGQRIAVFAATLTHLPMVEQFWVLGCSLRFVSAYVRTLIEYDFLPKSFKVESIDLTFGSAVTSSLDFKSRLKNCCIFWSSSLSKRSPPIILPFKGQTRKYIISLARSRPSMRKMGCAQSLLLLKKIALPVPENFVFVSLVEHTEKVTAPVSRQPLDWTALVVGECRLLVSKVWSPSRNVSDFSLRSTIESSRKNLGSYGWAVREFGTMTRVCGSYHRSLIEEGCCTPFRREVLPPYYQAIADLEIAFKDLCSPPPCESDEDQFIDLAKRGEQIDKLQQESDELPEFIFERKVVALREPLKVRIITIGHVWESAFWADFQKHVRDRLKPLSQNCSGKELPVHYFDHIVKERQRLETLTGEEWYFISDDGTAATDSIGTNLCAGALEHLIPPEYLELFHDSISNGRNPCQMHYKHEERSWTVDQTNSQLMGDRKSFVGLSMIHIAVKMAWMRGMADELGLPFSVLRKCFHINGDDGLIILPHRFIKRYMSFMGKLWELNPVKTQISRTFFSLNSRMFCDKRGVAFEPPFIRWNIIYRVGRTGEAMLNPTVWNELNSSLHGVASKRIWDLFHKQWKNTLDLLTHRTGNNYFLPQLCGGLGLVPSPNIEFEITPQQNALIVETQKLVNVAGKMPAWSTRTVPTYEAPLFKERRQVQQTGLWGLRSKPLTEHVIESRFPASGGLKKVTKSTKLKTKRVPINKRVYKPRDYDNLWSVDHGPLVFNHTEGQGSRLRSYY